MYGDLRHISVMQSEIENEIDFDEIQHSVDKYSKAFNTHHRKGKFATTEGKTTKKEERKNYRNGDTSEPHFRPVNNKQRTKPPKVVDKSSLIDNRIIEEMKAKSAAINATEVSGKTTKLTSITSPSSSTTPGSIKSTSTAINDEMLTKESDRENNKTVDEAVSDLFSNLSSIFTASSTVTSTTTSTTLETSTLSKALNEDTQEPSVTERSTQMDLDEKVTFGGENMDDEIEINERISSTTSTSKEPIKTTTTEALLFQDSMVVPIPVNKRGV